MINIVAEFSLPHTPAKHLPRSPIHHDPPPGRLFGPPKFLLIVHAKSLSHTPVGLLIQLVHHLCAVSALGREFIHYLSFVLGGLFDYTCNFLFDLEALGWADPPVETEVS